MRNTRSAVAASALNHSARPGQPPRPPANPCATERAGRPAASPVLRGPHRHGPTRDLRATVGRFKNDAPAHTEFYRRCAAGTRGVSRRSSHAGGGSLVAALHRTDAASDELTVSAAAWRRRSRTYACRACSPCSTAMSQSPFHPLLTTVDAAVVFRAGRVVSIKSRWNIGIQFPPDGTWRPPAHADGISPQTSKTRRHQRPRPPRA